MTGNETFFLSFLRTTAYICTGLQAKRPMTEKRNFNY